MKHYLIIIITATLFACNNDQQTTAENDDEAAVNNQPPSEKPAEETTVNLSGNTLATLDMSYTFRLHELVRYQPGEQMTKMFKLDDAKNDYYILDASVENITGEVFDTGRDMLSVYFKLSNGNTTKSSLKGASLLAAYNTENRPKYPQKQYDQLWSSKFPANSSARSHLFAAEVPEGVTITGIGFYEKNAAKNKHTDL
ncbi:MAG: hypothetical protein H0V30_10425 [Chitinophagaceae bacterium]|nr:hypothetical protein [Chitinophagaceae bacterium]